MSVWGRSTATGPGCIVVSAPKLVKHPLQNRRIHLSMTTPERQVGGRPRSFDTDQVVDAALELFWHQGYRGTSTRDLEAGLGIGQSSIYNAFGSKLRLLEAALDRYEHQISDALVTPLERSHDGIAAIDGFFAALAAWITTDG